MSHFRVLWTTLFFLGLYLPNIIAQDAHLKPLRKSKDGYLLSGTDISKQIVWGSISEPTDGLGLLFGGQDQNSPDGNPHTQIKKGGVFVSISKELKEKNPLQKFQERIWALRNRQKDNIAKLRYIYLTGLPAEETTKLVKEQCLPEQESIVKEATNFLTELKEANKKLKEYEETQVNYAIKYLEEAITFYHSILPIIKTSLKPKEIADLRSMQIILEKASETLDAEPPARNLSPIVYDSKTKLFVIFGGDHLDYLTNDTWVFDYSRQKWMQRHPKIAPTPRCNHLLKPLNDGKISLTEGIIYCVNPDYVPYQYNDSISGEWVYDIESDTWAGKEGIASDCRSYRSKFFLPEFYLEDVVPDANIQETILKNIPVNTWVDLKPPKRPPGNRDWGTVTLDTDHDILLRWSGGHSAYCGSDVAHYHLATNRWEMPFPAENPMGETTSSGPGIAGVNFNLRPYMTGHTYRSYGYDPLSKKMLSVSRAFGYNRKTELQDVSFHIYDPVTADWKGRGNKPPEMFGLDCYYTLTVCGTPLGAFVWTSAGKILKFNPDKNEWVLVKLSGTPLPGTSCDGSSLQYDSKKNRLLGIRTPSWNTFYDGEIYEIDLSTYTVKNLSPKGMKALSEMKFLREAAYDSQNNIFLVASSIITSAARTDQIPVYDCANNRWLGIKLEGKEQYSKQGFDVSLGLVYDSRRHLFWAVDARSNISVLRLDMKTAQTMILAE